MLWVKRKETVTRSQTPFCLSPFISFSKSLAFFLSFNICFSDSTVCHCFYSYIFVSFLLFFLFRSLFLFILSFIYPPTLSLFSVFLPIPLLFSFFSLLFSLSFHIFLFSCRYLSIFLCIPLFFLIYFFYICIYF